jgi:hypothetical protein
MFFVFKYQSDNLRFLTVSFLNDFRKFRVSTRSSRCDPLKTGICELSTTNWFVYDLFFRRSPFREMGLSSFQKPAIYHKTRQHLHTKCNMSVCLFVCLSNCHFVCLSFVLLFFLFVFLSFFCSFCLSICLSDCTIVFLLACLSHCRSACL